MQWVCRPASDPQLMSYRIFLDSFLLPFKVGEGAAIEAINTIIKGERQKLKRIFTEAGQPGDMFRSVHACTCEICLKHNRQADCGVVKALCASLHSVMQNQPVRMHSNSVLKLAVCLLEWSPQPVSQHLDHSCCIQVNLHQQGAIETSFAYAGVYLRSCPRS